MKKLIASILCACTISSLLVGCGSTSDQADQAGDRKIQSVQLNFYLRQRISKKVQKVQEMQRQMQMRIM